MEQELDLGLQEAKLQTVDLEKELLVLRLSFGKLKATASRAFAPITAGVVAGLSKATNWATRLMKNIGGVIAGVTGWRGAQESLTKSVKKTYKAVRRELAGFDEVNRLGTPKNQTVTTQVHIDPTAFQIPEGVQGIVDGILRAIEPLQNMDLTYVRWHFYRLKDAVDALIKPMGEGFSWVWYQVLVPFATWVVEQLTPKVFQVLENAAKALKAALEPLGTGFGRLLEQMKPVFVFVGDCLISGLDMLRRTFGDVAKTIAENGGTITQIFDNLVATIGHIWKQISPLLDGLRLDILSVFTGIRNQVKEVISQLITAFAGLTEFLLGVFTGNWEKAWNGLKKFLKNSINGILGLVNGMLSGIAGGINAVVKMLNKLKFTFPDWVPGYGGKSFGLNLPTVKAPQIPYLAKGAVLPANKPFLAVVGDQKHGTNIEAPLATIEQAVSNVFGDMLPAMVAGFEALLQENMALRRTVEGIHIADETIGHAVDRYNAKMEILRGV